MTGLWPSFLLWLSTVVLAQTTSMVGAGLQPSRVTYWRNKWAPAAVVLSSNHKSKAGVTVSFYISPATSLTNGVLEVSFPAGFVVSPEKLSATGAYQLYGQTFVGGEEYVVTAAAVTNPGKQGAYGPFALRTRQSPNGQQVDVNLSFGSVYIYGDAGVLSSLAVSLSGPKGGNTVNKTNNALIFKFSLGVSLWRYDTFVVTIDDRWTVAPGAVCTATAADGKWNNFNGSDPLMPHVLGCVVVPKTASSQGTVYIYGLAVDGIDVSLPENQFLQLQISGVTNPDAVYDTYAWSLSSTRFGTATTLESASLASGPALLPDTITTASWTPTWGMAASDVVSGTALFMDLSVTVANPVPAGGSVVIDVSEDMGTGDNNWLGTKNCYIVTYLGRNAACTVDVNTVTISNVGKIAGKTSVKVRNVVRVLSAAGAIGKVLSVRTYRSGANMKIDTGTNLAPFTVSTGVALPVNLYFQDSTASSSISQSQAGGLSGVRLALQFVILPASLSDLLPSSTVMIRAPLATTKENYRISLPSLTTVFFSDSSQPVPIAFPFGTQLLPAPTVTISSSGDPGIIGIPALLSSLTGGIHLGITSTAAATEPIALPLVVSNLATAYEYSVIIATVGKATLRGMGRFLVTPQAWAASSFQRPCDDNIDGLPGMFAVTPGVVPLLASSASAMYYVEVEIPGADSLGTALAGIKVTSPNEEESLSFAVAYPIAVDNYGTSKGFLYTRDAGSCVAIAGLPLISVTTSLSFVIPLGGLTPGAALTARVRSFFISAADPRYKQVTHDGGFPAVNLIPSTASVANPGFTLEPSSGTTGEVTTSVFKSTITLGAGFSYLYMGLPSGYMWAASQGVRYQTDTTTTTSPKLRYFSGFSGFRFPGVLITSTGSIPSTFTLAGLVLPLGAETATFSIALGSGSGTCVPVSTLSFTVLSGTISGLAVAPTAIKSRGPDGVGIAQKVSFTLQHGVPPGGSVSMTISDQWTTTSFTTCVVAGPKVLISCSFTANIVTLTGFQSQAPQTQLSVQLDNLLSPSTASTTPYDFVTALSSYSGTKVVDSLPATVKSPVTVAQSSLPGKSTVTTKRTFPMYAGAKQADLYLKFTLQHPLPRFGAITVASQATIKRTGTGKDSCFLAPLRYSDCSYADNKVTITIDQSYTPGTLLEVYLESLLDTATLAGFSVTTSWAGTAVDSTSSELAASYPQLSSAFLSSNVTATPTAACEPATYTISILDTADYQAGDQFWVLFPPQYDYFLGDAAPLFSTDPTGYYLQCGSDQLGPALCSVSRRLVTITGGRVVGKSTQIQVSIYSVRNPPPGVTDSFQVLHVNSTASVVSMAQSVAGVTTTALVANIALRSSTVTEDRLFRMGDYTWRMYLPEKLTATTVLQVTFPKEFDLLLTNLKESYYCTMTVPGQKRRMQDGTQTCSLARNTLTFVPGRVIPAGNLTIWTAESLSTPQFALLRSALSPASDFDVTDDHVWPLYTNWLSKFTVYMYNSTSSGMLQARSYENTNAAYVGFRQAARTLVVNGFNPVTKAGRIVVRAGTQTIDVVLSTLKETQPLAAKEVVLTAKTNPRTSDNGLLRYSSGKDLWRIEQGQWQMRFRVAAGLEMAKGLYYVDWTVKETLLPGMSTSQYDPPVSTLIEVLPKAASVIPVFIGKIQAVSPGFRSVPVNITLANPPASGLTVHLEIEGSPGYVSVAPADLSFTPDVAILTFQIQVDQLANTTEDQLLLLSLSGTDAYVFSIPPSQAFTVAPCQAAACLLCPLDCLRCDSLAICTVCVTGKHPTYTGGCKDCSNCDENLRAMAAGPVDNKYAISFNHYVPREFAAADFELRMSPPSEIQWELLANTTIHVFGGPWSSSTWLVIKIVTPVIDEFGFPLENYEITVVPPLEPAPLPMKSSIETSAVAVTSTIAVTAVGTGVAVGGGSLALALLSQMQYFSYIGTAQYTMGGDMNNFYTSLNQKSTLPNPFSRSKGFARRLDTATDLIQVSDFLDSAGQYVTLLFGIVVVHCAVWGLQRALGARWPWLVRLHGKFVWGTYLYFWYFAYLDLLVAALLQLKNTSSEWLDARKAACNVLAILFVGLTGVTPFALFAFLQVKRGELFAGSSNRLKERFGSLTSDLRCDSLLSKFLVAVYYFQRFLYAFLIVFVRGTRTAQVIVLIVPTGIMALFVVLSRPLFRKSCRLLHIVAEVDALVVYVILCVAALVYDSLDTGLSWIIVALTLKSFLCTTLIFIIETVATIRESCHRKKVYAISTVTETQDIKTTVNLPYDTEISFADSVLFAKRDPQKFNLEEASTDRCK